MASDLGQPVPYETMQPLQVALEDIDDNEPLFVRPPVSSPTSCAGHTYTGTHLPASTHTHTLSYIHCARIHIWLDTETSVYMHFMQEQLFIEQLCYTILSYIERWKKKKKKADQNA